MTEWFIIRTSAKQEHAVASAIEAMGHETWVPAEFRYRSRIVNGTVYRRSWEIPVLARYLFAAIPEAVHGDLQSLEGFDAVWRDSRLRAISVAFDEVQEFRDGLDKHNGRMRRHFQRLTERNAGRKPKRYRGFDALKSLLDVPIVDEMEDAA